MLAGTVGVNDDWLSTLLSALAIEDASGTVLVPTEDPEVAGNGATLLTDRDVKLANDERS